MPKLLYYEQIHKKSWLTIGFRFDSASFFYTSPLPMSTSPLPDIYFSTPYIYFFTPYIYFSTPDHSSIPRLLSPSLLLTLTSFPIGSYIMLSYMSTSLLLLLLLDSLSLLLHSLCLLLHSRAPTPGACQWAEHPQNHSIKTSLKMNVVRRALNDFSASLARSFAALLKDGSTKIGAATEEA